MYYYQTKLSLRQSITGHKDGHQKGKRIKYTEKDMLYMFMPLVTTFKHIKQN